jgi:integrase
MPTRKLTAEFVERTKPGAALIEFIDKDVRGRGRLMLRITPAGDKGWSLRYRLPNGERKRIALGTYPAVSLAKARDAAALTLGAVASGKNPAAEKKAAKATAERGRLETLANLADQYFEAAAKGRHRQGKARPKRSQTLNLERYYWERRIRPAFGRRAIRSITRADIQTFVNAQGAPSTGLQVRVVFQRLFAFARWLEIADADPARYVQVDVGEPRERVLTDAELKALWRALNDPKAIGRRRITRRLAIGVALCAVTLQRRGEVAGIDLAELDLAAKTWIIPAARTKNGRAHLVPLSDDAIALIEEAKGLRVDHGEAEANPLFPTTLSEARPIDADNLTRAFVAAAKEAKLSNARLHDLRRTGATAMTSERIGIPRFIVSRVLNHASDRGDAAVVTAVYDRNAYLPEKRKALDAWAALLRQIISDEPRASNVIALKGQQ